MLAKRINENTAGYNAPGVYYQLTDDIYLNHTADWQSFGTAAPANEWTPIGNVVNGQYNGNRQFFANFDGKGFSVHGVYVDSTDSYQGLFGVIAGNINNLGVTESFIRGKSLVGSIAAMASEGSSVTNCHNTGTVISFGNAGEEGTTGGIVGHAMHSSIVNCYNTGKVTGGIFAAGGIAGTLLGGNVENCYNTGAVSGAANYVGGVAGSLDGGAGPFLTFLLIAFICVLVRLFGKKAYAKFAKK